MKRVIILYKDGDIVQKKLAVSLQDGVEKTEKSERMTDGAEYSVTIRSVASTSDMAIFLDEVNPEVCQLILNINLTGYEMKTTGGIASINQIPLDIVNVITGKISWNRVCEELEEHQSYMSRFIFMDSKHEKEVRERFLHLWHMEFGMGIDEIVEYLRGMKLRWSE